MLRLIAEKILVCESICLFGSSFTRPDLAKKIRYPNIPKIIEKFTKHRFVNRTEGFCVKRERDIGCSVQHIWAVTEVTRSRVPKPLLTLHSYCTTYKQEK